MASSWTKTKRCAVTRTESIKCTCCLAATWWVCSCCGQPTCSKRQPHLSKGIVRPRDQTLPSSCLPALLGWVWVGRHSAGKARKKLLLRLPKCLQSSTTSRGCLVWKSRSLEWKPATSYSVPPFTDLFLGLSATKMYLKYDFSLKHLTKTATRFIYEVQNVC